MSHSIPSTVIKKATSKSEALLQYLYARDYEDLDRSTRIDLELCPMEHAEKIHKAWQDEYNKKYKDKKYDFETEDRDIRNSIPFDDREYHRAFMSYSEEFDKTKKIVKNKANSLPALATKLSHIFIQKLGDRKWLYSYSVQDDVYYPMLVKSVKYKAKDRYNETASVVIELVYNSENKTTTRNVSISMDDFREHGKDPLEILKAKNLLFETSEFYARYEEQLKDYQTKSVWQNKQIVYFGKKYIQDNIYEKTKGRGRFSSSELNEKVLSNFSGDGELSPVPYDFTIYAFNLKEHKHEWIRTPNVELYVYDKEIEKKLVLPKEHKMLIDILLNTNIKAMGSDIISGKGAGTIVLAKGVAGVGKTATAETYSEKKELPLYSVHSSQLGISGDKLEEKLKDIFEKVERWGCILLIDEADVYIRKRDNDVNHNAIVASLLRVLEYYNGLMFLTTNRTEDVDEAIESRCSAILRYKRPDEETKEGLWRLFAKQFHLDVSDEVILRLAKDMKNISGRDIKNISSLVSRYIQAEENKDLPLDFEVFKTCATFRGLYDI